MKKEIALLHKESSICIEENLVVGEAATTAALKGETGYNDVRVWIPSGEDPRGKTIAEVLGKGGVVVAPSTPPTSTKTISQPPKLTPVQKMAMKKRAKAPVEKEESLENILSRLTAPGTHLQIFEKQLNEVRSQNGELRAENRELRAKIENASAQNRELRTMIEDVSEKNKSQQEEITDLKTEMKHLVKQNETLEKIIKHLVNQNEALEKTMKHLVNQNETLEKTMAQVVHEMDSIHIENSYGVLYEVLRMFEEDILSLLGGGYRTFSAAIKRNWEGTNPELLNEIKQTYDLEKLAELLKTTGKGRNKIVHEAWKERAAELDEHAQRLTSHKLLTPQQAELVRKIETHLLTAELKSELLDPEVLKKLKK